MRRREWHELRGANLAFFTPDSHELKNLNFALYSRHANQSGACSSSDVITSRGRKSETTMEDKLIVVVCGYPELYDITSYFYKNRNKKDLAWKKVSEEELFAATRPRLSSESSVPAWQKPLPWREFAGMKRVNSKCSSVQLRANSSIYSLHSRLVWTYL